MGIDTNKILTEPSNPEWKANLEATMKKEQAYIEQGLSKEQKNKALSTIANRRELYSSDRNRDVNRDEKITAPQEQETITEVKAITERSKQETKALSEKTSALGIGILKANQPRK